MRVVIALRDEFAPSTSRSHAIRRARQVAMAIGATKLARVDFDDGDDIHALPPEFEALTRAGWSIQLHSQTNPKGRGKPRHRARTFLLTAPHGRTS